MKIVRFYGNDDTVRRGVLEEGQETVARCIEGDIFSDHAVTEEVIPVKRLLAPLEPRQIYAVGLNYRRHAEETGAVLPERPEVFMKAVTSVVGSGENIVLPAAGPDEVDYEGELAIIIGRAARNVTPEEAENYIFGYCCANDVSARDWQWRKQQGQWIRAKSFDTFCPLGPAITTVDEIPDANGLRIETRLNGKTMQNSTTADMLFTVFDIVSDLSRSVTLTPGTVILTGTPEGVGFSRKPPVFLAPGDEISVQIQGLGILTNTVVSEK